jgi:hypothetical protein
MPESEQEQRERLLIVNNVYANYALFDEIMEDIERCHELIKRAGYTNA